jgi:hypothetical protein
MTRVSKRLRAQVIERAKGRCEYCQTQEDIVVDLEVEHIHPSAKGGVSSLDNLCYACGSCNRFKSDFTHSVDPETGENVLLYNPRNQIWENHFAWSEDGLTMMGLTSIGRATVKRLNVNKGSFVKARRRWVAAGWHPPK